MNWQEIREQFPHRWLVVEALDGRTEGGKRVIKQLDVLDSFGDDWQRAWEYYKHVHQVDRMREYYVLHTDRLELDIAVQDAFGRKVTA